MASTRLCPPPSQKWVVPFVFLFAFITTSYAGIGFQPVSQEELKMTVEPAAPGASAIILYRQVDRDDSLDSASCAKEENYVRIKVLKEEGRKFADIEIPYDNDGFQINGLHARSIRPDGTISNFEGRPFSRTIVKAKGVKYKAKTLTLPDVQVGSIIEYYYTVDLPEHMLYDSYWIVSHDLFMRRAKFSLRPYSRDYSMRYIWNGLPAGVRPKNVNDKLIAMDVENIAAFETEDYMPPRREMQARVDFIYQERTASSEKDRFWKEVGKSWYSSMEGFTGKRKAMEQAVGEIVSPSDTTEQKLRKIYARVQQLRNTSMEAEKTEQQLKREKEKTANNVESVWKNGYGNGHQINWLFLALARAAGLEAYGCWVSDRSNYLFNPNILDKHKLDADVVMVKLDGKDRYFDPGTGFTPFGLLPWSETGVAGLLLDKDGGGWIQTPMPDQKDARIERKAELTLSETGDLEGKLTVTFIGLEAAWRRMEERNADSVARKKFLEEDVKENLPVVADLELTGEQDWKSSEAPLVAIFNLKLAGWISGSGKRVMFPVGMFSNGEKHVFDNARRTYGIYRHFPNEAVDELTVTLPEGWQVLSLPVEKKQVYPVVQYTNTVQNDGGKLKIERRIGFNFIFMPKENYAAIRQFYNIVRDSDEEQVLLRPASAAGAN